MVFLVSSCGCLVWAPLLGVDNIVLLGYICRFISVILLLYASFSGRLPVKTVLFWIFFTDLLAACL